MSAEGKSRIAAAQKERWAKQRKSGSSTAKRAVNKKTVQAKVSAKRAAAKSPKKAFRVSSNAASKATTAAKRQPRKAVQSRKIASRTTQAGAESQGNTSV